MVSFHTHPAPCHFPNVACTCRPSWEFGDALAAAQVGDKIRFVEERIGYTVQARGARYLVCSKPYALYQTTLYTIVDLEQWVRGPENLIFGLGAETREQCEAMLARLEGRDPDGLHSEVSHRRRIELRVRAVVPA